MSLHRTLSKLLVARHLQCEGAVARTIPEMLHAIENIMRDLRDSYRHNSPRAGRHGESLLDAMRDITSNAMFKNERDLHTILENTEEYVAEEAWENVDIEASRFVDAVRDL